MREEYLQFLHTFLVCNSRTEQVTSGWQTSLPPARMWIVLSLYSSNSRLELRRRIKFMWFPDQEPRNFLMLTNAVIWATSVRAEWGHPLAADRTGIQTKVAGGVCGAETQRNGEGGVVCPVGRQQTALKSSLLLFPNQHEVSRSEGGRSAMSPSGQQEKGWMNLKQTSERLAVFQSEAEKRAAKILLDRLRDAACDGYAVRNHWQH